MWWTLHSLTLEATNPSILISQWTNLTTFLNVWPVYTAYWPAPARLLHAITIGCKIFMCMHLIWHCIHQFVPWLSEPWLSCAWSWLHYCSTHRTCLPPMHPLKKKDEPMHTTQSFLEPLALTASQNYSSTQCYKLTIVNFLVLPLRLAGLQIPNGGSMNSHRFKGFKEF